MIQVTSAVKQFGALPKSGGILDQDAYLVLGMQHVLDAYRVKEEVEERRKRALRRGK